MINAIITAGIAFFFFLSLLLCMPAALLLRKTRAPAKHILRALRVSVLRYPRRFFVLLELVFAKWFRVHFAAKIRRSGVYPEVCVFQVTTECNNSCAFCFSHGEEKAELTVGTLGEAVRKMKAKGCVLFILSGGEPTLYAGLGSVVRENRDAYFVIITNGKKPAKVISIAEQNRNCVFLISMQSGADESSAVRGKETVASAEALMRELRSRNIPFGVNCVLTRSGMARMSEASTYRRLETLGASLLWLVPYIPVGKGAHEEHVVSRQSMRAFQAGLRGLRMQTSLIILALLGDKELLGCSAGKHILYVDAFQKVYPCMFLTEPIGSLGDAGLLETISRWAGRHWDRKEKTCRALQNAGWASDQTEER